MPGHHSSFLALVFCCIVCSASGYAKERKLPKEYTFLLDVRDNLTRRPISMAEVHVIEKRDSTEVTHIGITQDGEARVIVPAGCDRYTISVTKRNFDDKTLWQYESEKFEYAVKDKYKSTQIIEPIFLKHRKSKQLNEVSVTASKVMFYYKGDTLIYNADAFVLAEGSMLDGLISQMPGVELKRNGEIKVNGKKVSNLLLNGKDLFNGNRQLMLENLAAYTVKDIAVYDKVNFESEVLGINVGKQFVMDVRLKRQYKHGFLGNVEAGYGTDNRYRAKLFGMWYSENVSMTAFLSSNNLNNDARPKPGYSDGSWSDTQPSTGTGSYHSGGLTYNAEGPDRKWMVKGDAAVRYNDGTMSRTQNTAVLIPGNEMFQYGHNDTRSKDISVSTTHTFKASLSKRAVLTVLPQFEYSRRKSEGLDISASFNQEIKDISRSVIESTYSADNMLTYNQHLLNRAITSSLERNNRFNFKVNGYSLIKLSPADGRAMLTVGATANIDNRGMDSYTYRCLDFTSAPAENSSLLQHNDSNPYKDSEYRGYAKFSQSFDFQNAHLSIVADYDYARTEQTRTSQFYQEERLLDYLTPSILPDYSSSLPIDPGESYRSRQWENLHSLNPSVTIHNEYESYKPQYGMRINVPIAVSHRALDYHRDETDQYLSSTKFLTDFKASVWFSLQQQQRRRLYQIDVDFTSSVRQPQMLNMVNVVNGTDPMNTILGNPDLANPRVNTVSLTLSAQGRKPVHYLSMSYTTIKDAISQGYYYISSTGQRISRPYNVDGNRNAKASYRISWYKMDRYNLSNELTGGYQCSRELIGSIAGTTAEFDTSLAPPSNRVDNLSVSDRIEANFNFSGKYSLKAFVDMGLRKFRSFDASFGSDLTFNGSYGASAILNLPRNWGLSTDLTLYTRRGYLDSRLNTTDVLWNSRVTKSFLKGSLVCAIEGYDLLRQLSNVSYTVNAQYRTETVTNVIPAYVLLSVQFRFNKQPKR